MSYIGNTFTTQAFTPAVDFFNGNGSTVAFTLSRPVASVAQVQAVISNVPQKPGDAFTVSGNTITFTSAPPSGTQNIYVYYTSPITQVIAPGQGTVGTAQIQEGAVITADIANGAVTTAKLSSTTGTGAVALASLPSFTTTIGVGGATASASGSGVSFPATQSASSDANTLDDYEEGTWTPAVKGGTTAGTYVYESNRTGGRYTKVGNLVTIWAVCRISSITSAGSGSLVLTGLPFPTGPNMAPVWTNSDGIQVAMYANGTNSSATTYPPPFFADTDGSGTTTATVLSYGKNYVVNTDITALSGASWIYLISGSYTTS